MEKKVLFLFGLIILFSLKNMAQKNENLLEQILHNSKGIVKEISENAQKYELQIIYTQIDRDKKNHPHFTTFYFNVNRTHYFYPASTVKMPIAFLALEKVNKLKKQGINISKNSVLKIDSVAENQIAVFRDSSSSSGYASIEHYIKKIFLVSDNDAYNRLFEFLGADYINKTLEDKGIEPIKITHRLSVSGLDNTITPSMSFFENDKKIYFQSAQQAKNLYQHLDMGSTLKGKGYYSGENLINEPMDFSQKNFYPLESMLKTLQRIIFPEVFTEKERFDLTKADYKFLYKYMSISPLESDFPKYDEKEYWDSYVKFFIFGDSKQKMPENIKIFNKVGDAYGFLLDCAYIVDFDINVEFFLSAVILVNEDQIYNDNKYEYETIGFPFMAALGKEILKYEQTRFRTYIPNLKKFK